MSETPWLFEPNEIDFIDEGTNYPCAMRRGPRGAWLGYVGVGVKHPWFGKTYGDKVKAPPGTLNRPVDQEEIGVFNIFIATFSNEEVTENSIDIALCIRCHGGLTFGGRAWWDKHDSDLWWLGFDCAHCDDLQPKLIEHCPRMMEWAVYRDEAYVRKVLKMMCADIKVAEMFLV